VLYVLSCAKKAVDGHPLIGCDGPITGAYRAPDQRTGAAAGSIERTDRLNSKLNAVVSRDLGRAYASARLVDDRRNRRESLFPRRILSSPHVMAGSIIARLTVLPR
jgi:hypothetical protein